MTMPTVVTIGEAFLALRADVGSILETTKNLDVMLAGSEVNVAIGLSRLGVNTSWIGKLPTSALGRNIINSIRRFDVDVSKVCWVDNGNVGLAFIELGVPPRPNRMVYFRQGSCASTMSIEDLDWEFVRQAKHLHLSGITSALSQSCHQVNSKAIDVARKNGLTISFDINYRSSLWSIDEARSTLLPIIENLDLVFVSLMEAKGIFSVEGNPERIAEELFGKLKCGTLVLKKGAEGSVIQNKDISFTCPSFRTSVVNRFGAGDAYSAGFLYGFFKGDVRQAAVFGTAMAAHKMSVLDVNSPVATKEEIEEIILREEERKESTQLQIHSRDVIR